MSTMTAGLTGSRMVALALVFGAGLALTLAGCAASAARLQRSQEVYESFRGARVLPGHTYYTTGVESNPDAILAIADGYTLRTERWKEREMTPELLRYLVGRMDDEFAALAAGLAGSAVMNDRGEAIGVWYSAVDITRVEMLGPTEVRISPPVILELDKRKDDRGR